MSHYSKAIGGTGAAAITAVIVWALRTYTTIDIPKDVEDALIVILAFLGIYFAPANTPPESVELQNHKRRFNQ